LRSPPGLVGFLAAASLPAADPLIGQQHFALVRIAPGRLLGLGGPGAAPCVGFVSAMLTAVRAAAKLTLGGPLSG